MDYHKSKISKMCIGLKIDETLQMLLQNLKCDYLHIRFFPPSSIPYHSTAVSSILLSPFYTMLGNSNSYKFSANCLRILLKMLFPQTVVQFVFSFLFFLTPSGPPTPSPQTCCAIAVVFLFMKCLKIRGAWTFSVCLFVCLSC